MFIKKRKVWECDLNSSWTVKEQEHVPCGFGYKVVCIDDKFSKNVVVHRGMDCMGKFISSVLSEYEYCKSVAKNNFNKNLIMSMGEEEMFQKACSCWI